MKPKGDRPHLRYTFDRDTHIKYLRLMKTLQSSLAFEASDVAKFRLRVLNHYYKYGLRPAIHAFGIGKSTLYDWKTAFESSGKRLASLVPKSTRPYHTRTMNTDWRLVAFIKAMRTDYGNVGSHIIKPFLDEHASSLSISSISLSTIEKIIKRRKFTFESRVNYKRKTRYSKKLRIKRSPKATKPGYIQMDSIIIYVNKEKHLFMSIIDIYTKLALVVKVNSLSSLNAREALKTFIKLCPYSVHTVQTDNGSEFLARFHDYLEEETIKHIFIYPRLCKVNGVVERFNRTVQEEFIKRNDEIYYDLNAFEGKLTNWLTWYNQKRPHYSLNYLSPMQFINTKIPESG